MTTTVSQEDAAIASMINSIWDMYDKDKSGSLDREETKQFVMDTLMEKRIEVEE